MKEPPISSRYLTCSWLQLKLTSVKENQLFGEGEICAVDSHDAGEDCLLGKGGDHEHSMCSDRVGEPSSYGSHGHIRAEK